MLTIKQVNSNSEALFQGSEVMYYDGEAGAAALQVMYLDGKEWKSLTSGLIYVMNESGKTVATYSLVPVNESALGRAA